MEELIRIQNLNKSYGKKKVLKNVNLSLTSGKIIGLLGPNGSGKTTLIKILNGLLKDYQGEILIDQQPLGVHSKSIISYLPDEPYFENWMTTTDALNLFKDLYQDFDSGKAISLMERMNIEKNVKIKELSYDQSINEIAKLISGKEVSQESINHAKKLKISSE